MVFLKNNVTDGKLVFKDYKWCVVDGEKRIWSCYTKRLLSPTNRNTYIALTLTINHKQCIRSFALLKRNSFPEEFLPAKVKKFKDVFGYQDYYCFNPKNPFEIWSKKKMMYVIPASNHNKISQHFKFNIAINGKSSSMYVHRMVWEFYHKQTLKEGWQIHHLSHDWRDCSRKNLIALPKKVHVIFEKYYGMYKNVNSFYKTNITKQQMIQKINEFAISKKTKQKLIQSL